MEYKRKWMRLNAEVEALAQADSDLEDSFYQNSPPTAFETVHHGPGEFESDQEQLLLDSTCGSSSSSESDFSLALEEISDDECALTDDSVLSEEIATWASQHNCTRSSINHVLDLFRKHGHRVPKDSKTLLQTPRFIETKEKCGGQFLYLGIETGLLKLAAQNVTHFKSLKEVLLNFNIDGVPLFKSTNGQLWPILCSVCNFEPFVIAVYHGKSKPSSVEDYLSEFLLEVKNLCDNGITLGENVLPLKVNAFVCDAPARSFLKCIKAHNAYFSCERCCVRGSWQGRVVFDIDLENAPPRNEETFNKLGYSDHQVKRSPLVDAGVSCIASFVLDYMHLVCLGVVKRILSFLKNGPRDCKLSQLQLTQLSHNLCSLNGKMPRDFARQPRSIFEVDRWKATEFRQFLLYTGPLVLRSVVSSKLYNHFLTLSVALSILLDSNDCTRNAYISYAEELLLFFVQNGKDIYGPTFTSYNVHSLIHLADDVKHFGKSLNDISAFQFENYLHKLKKNVRKAQNPISQVAKRIAELERSKNRPVLKFVGSSLSTKKKDSCVLLKNHNYAFVIERRPNKHFVCDVISQSYLHNFFESPCNSKLINIAVLKPRMLSKYAKRLVVNVEEIDKKAVCLPFDGSYLLVPMLHTFERH